jgi:chromosome segregation ATPase
MPGEREQQVPQLTSQDLQKSAAARLRQAQAELEETKAEWKRAMEETAAELSELNSQLSRTDGRVRQSLINLETVLSQLGCVAKVTELLTPNDTGALEQHGVEAEPS